jgi:hypothetical protein
VNGVAGAEQAVTVRVSVLDLDRRIAVVQAEDNGYDTFPHVLRGTLAAMFAESTWHVVVAFDDDQPPRREVAAVLDQAKVWSHERRCRLTVTTRGEIDDVTAREP